MIKALEIYDSFDPKVLLEIRFVTVIDEKNHYDWKNHSFGTTYTSRTFRSRYASLREVMGGLEKV